MDLFEVKLKYQKEIEDGRIGKRNDSYVVEAYNFTDAEAVIVDMITTYSYMAPVIKGMKPVNYTDVFGDNEYDRWYKVSIKILAEIKEDGKEKWQKQQMLVNANTLDEALRISKENLKNMSVDWESVGIQETQIVEVIRK